VDGGKGAPKCILKPVIKYQCCVPSGGSTANIDVTVTNPNPVKLKIRVWLDGSAPTEKWVDGDGTAKFNFAGVGNGEHVIHSAVAVGKGAWCQFGDKKITVKCASPSPSPSGSKSPSPSPSVSATVAVPPGNGEPSLPVTGPAVAVYTVVGVGLVAGGWLLYRRFRRNRVTFVA
jgi:LPXTG-motif cell wall-anchored protein